MTQREISLKKDETLLVKWIAEPFRYARLARIVDAGGRPYAYVFDIHPAEPAGDTQLSEAEVRFYASDCLVSLGSGGGVRSTQVFPRNTWGQKTVKQLLASVLAEYTGGSGGYEIVDWGGFAVPNDRPASEIY